MQTVASVISVPAHINHVLSREIFRKFKNKKPVRTDFHRLTRLEADLARFQEVYKDAHQNLLREWIRYGSLEKVDHKEIGRLRLMMALASTKIGELYAELNVYDRSWHSHRAL